MSADRISLTNFMFALADEIKPRVHLLDADTKQDVNVMMFDALCAADEGDAEQVKRLVWIVRWKLKPKLEREQAGANP